MRPTGLKRRHPDVALRYAVTRRYSEILRPPSTVFQSVLWIRDQGRRPSCVGQSFASAVEAFQGYRVSAVDLWTDARRRDGTLAHPDEGTTSESAIESLIHRGISPYVSGEDERPIVLDTELCALGQELAADDARLSPQAEHHVLTSPEQAVDALLRNLGVCHGGPVNDLYQGLQRDEVVRPKHLTGNAGHERRLFGYIASYDLFLEANSWGPWAGITLLAGFEVPQAFQYAGLVVPAGPLERAIVLPGACWLSPEGLMASWAVDSIAVLG